METPQSRTNQDSWLLCSLVWAVGAGAEMQDTRAKGAWEVLLGRGVGVVEK